jgi:chromosome segregation ATPase
MNSGKTKPFSVRLEEETQERLEKLKASTGMTAEQTISLLLDSYESQDPAIALDCPKLAGPRRELPVVQKNLQAALDSVAAAICIAEQESAQAQLEARQATELAHETIVNLSEANKTLKQELNIAAARQAELEAVINEMQLNVRTLREQAESVMLLKAAWSAKEIEMTAQIENLNKKAEKAIQLQSKYEEAVRDLHTATSKLSYIEEELNKASNINSSLQEKIEVEISNRISLNSQLSDLNAEIRSLNKHILLLETNINEKNNSILIIEDSLKKETSFKIAAEQSYAVALAKIEAFETSLQKTEERLRIAESTQSAKKAKSI